MRIVLEIEGAEVSITAKESGSKVQDKPEQSAKPTASGSQGVAAGAEDAGPAPTAPEASKGAPTGPLDKAGTGPQAQAPGRGAPTGISGTEDAGPAPALDGISKGLPSSPLAATRRMRSADETDALDAGAAPSAPK